MIMRDLIRLVEAASIYVSREDDPIGSGETALTKQIYVVRGAPDVKASLQVLDYGDRDPGRVVQTIEVWPEAQKGKGYGQRLYMAALMDGPLNERPQFRSEEASRTIERLIAKGLVERTNDEQRRLVLILTKKGRSGPFIVENTQSANMPMPAMLYHATYRAYLRKIKIGGLHGNNPKKNWEDSRSGVVYLATEPEIAESYAGTSDDVPEDWLDRIVVLRIATASLDPTLFQSDQNVIDGADTFEYAGVIPTSAITVMRLIKGSWTPA